MALDFLDARGAVWRTVEMPRNASGGQAPCTLSYGSISARSTSWWLETEGLPSRASVTGDVVMLPCHGSPVGAQLTELVRDSKTIAAVAAGVGGSTHRVVTLPFDGYTGVRGTATGLRQAASLDGRSGFWVAGIAASRYGIRYVAPGSTNTTRVHGSTFYSTAEGAMRYQPGTLDVRGLALYGTRLLITSSYAVERNRNMPDTGMWRGWTPWGGLVAIGNNSEPNPRTSQRDSRLVRGFSGRSNYWTFVFESDRSLWLVQDRAVYRPASQGEATAFDARLAGSAPLAGDEPAALQGASTRPVNVRVSLGTAVVHWQWVSSAWVEGASIVIPSVACYSLAGRAEARVGWVVYTASRDAVFRVVTATRAVSLLHRAATGTLFRGVVLPPVAQLGSSTRLPARAPSSLDSSEESPSPTGSRSRTRSRSLKPRSV